MAPNSFVPCCLRFTGRRRRPEAEAVVAEAAAAVAATEVVATAEVAEVTTEAEAEAVAAAAVIEAEATVAAEAMEATEAAQAEAATMEAAEAAATMTMEAASSSLWPPSSISTSSGTKYDVFLSFRGPDTRNGFADCLYISLINASIKVFRDNNDLDLGENIPDALVQSIKQSKISIPIISKDYASSRSCLMELAQMVECKEADAQLIVPIFYDIDPADLKYQRGCVEESFSKHERRRIDRKVIYKWKQALRKITEMMGYDLRKTNKGYGAIIERVVSDILGWLKKNDLDVTDGLVGMEPHVREVMKKLGVIYVNEQAIGVHDNDVRILGIWGMPGIGKTTLARVVYNKIHRLFQRCSFLSNIRENGASVGLIMGLQEQLISNLRRRERRRLGTLDQMTNVIKSSFSEMKVLILLDDVHHFDQIKHLVGNLSWFGHGSRILMTVGNIDVLDSYGDGVADMYQVGEMETHQALRLFHMHAFSGYPCEEEDEYDSLSRDIVDAIGGIPLAIEVTASYLHERKGDRQIWLRTLDRLRRTPKNKVQEVINISYDALDYKMKEIFFDIACFFIGTDESIPSYMWVACEYYLSKGIKFLCDTHLIKMRENKDLWMHSLLREFCREIVKMEDCDEPQKCSRLWNSIDALTTLYGEEEVRKKDEAKESVRPIGNSYRESPRVAVEYPVGIDKQVDNMMDLLDLDVSDVRIVGIWGMGGVGKTTLAKVIYERISSQFDSCSFLADIGATAEQLGGIWLLQSKLMYDILEREYKVDQVAKGVDFFKGILRNKKVLIVLDDVEVQSHLYKIVGKKLDWFGYGSRIIVTTSNKSVLPEFIPGGLAEVYSISMLNDDQALELFSKHALRRNLQIPDFDEIATGIINYVNGIPLQIEAIGSLLSGKAVEEWSAITELFLQSGLDIEEILTVSYKELFKEHREIFLDIACLPPDVDCRIASFMWRNPHFSPSDGVDALHAMSLVKIGKNNELGMHRLLREFGRQIIRKEDHLDPAMRGRLCNLELAWNTEKMEGTDHLNFVKEDFESMPNIRFLILDCAKVVGDFANVFPNLKWLQWQRCTRDFEATNFHVEKLLILDLSWSKVTEDWGGWRKIKMPQLKVLNLTGCADLLISPDLSSFPDLEILILERCSRLVKLDPSIRHLKCLTTLNLRFCHGLNMLPIELGHMKALKELLIDGTSVQEIPVSMGYMEKLEIFSASNCLELSHLPDSVCGLTALLVLSLGNAKITRIPASVEKLVKLRILSLKDCCWIGRLPDSICNLGNSLEELDITGTGISELLNSITCLGRLKVLKMDSSFVGELPREIGNLVNLEELHASHCRSLKGAFPTAIKSLDRLRILRLGHSSISSIPLEIGSLSCLQTLDLLRCNEIQALPELPSSLTCLRVSSERMETLPALKDLVKLEEICLGDKDPNEQICLSTWMEPKSRSSDLLIVPIVLPKLKLLELSHSRVSELQLGHGSLSCTHLKKLVLSGVNLENVPELPASLSILSIRHCSSLKQLPSVHHLSKLSELNLIQSAIEEIKGLQGLIALEILNITHCEIHNLIGLGQLRDLRSLILSGCDSLGRLPDISNLKMLNVLVVERCRMIHDIEGLMELTSLEVLHVSECKAESTQQVQDALKLTMERSMNS